VGDIRYLNASWRDMLADLDEPVDLVICDPIYASRDLSYVQAVADALRPGGSLYVFGDCSRIAETKLALDEAGLQLLNWMIWPNDWGGRSNRKWAQKHDDILFYEKPGGERTWHPERVQIPKVMTAASFNPSGRTTKTPTSVWNDLAGFSTMASERIKLDGKAVRWQKPLRLIERMVLASSEPGQLVLDPFAGVATVAAVCLPLGRRCLSSEISSEIHALGAERLRLLAV
jgi:DNA modification methylase